MSIVNNKALIICCNLLLVNGHPRPMEQDMVREFRKELAQIRDKINFLFDRLESAEVEAEKASMTQRKNMVAAKQESRPVPEKGLYIYHKYKTKHSC